MKRSALPPESHGTGCPKPPLLDKPALEKGPHRVVDSLEPARSALDQRPDRVQICRYRRRGLGGLDVSKGAVHDGVSFRVDCIEKRLPFASRQDNVDFHTLAVSYRNVDFKEAPGSGQHLRVEPACSSSRPMATTRSPKSRCSASGPLPEDNFATRFSKVVLVEAERADPDVGSRRVALIADDPLGESTGHGA